MDAAGADDDSDADADADADAVLTSSGWPQTGRRPYKTRRPFTALKCIIEAEFLPTSDPLPRARQTSDGSSSSSPLHSGSGPSMVV